VADTTTSAPGAAPGVVHYHLGRLALAAGEPAEARRHREQALRDAARFG